MYYGSDILRSFVPHTGSAQISSNYYLDMIIGKINIVMDLGCGEGNSIDYFRGKNHNIKWVGLDVISSPVIKRRGIRKDAEIIFYNGFEIPFKSGSFDLIYCNQVFEHVEKPTELMGDIYRVLKPDGYLVGSTSHLEPFHALSICNFTPYGFNLLLKSTSFKLLEVRPGIDIFTLLFNRIVRRLPLISKISKLILRYFEKESPINCIIGILGKILRKNDQEINLLKLLFCGHFRFLAKKMVCHEK